MFFFSYQTQHIYITSTVRHIPCVSHVLHNKKKKTVLNFSVSYIFQGFYNSFRFGRTSTDVLKIRQSNSHTYCFHSSLFSFTSLCQFAYFYLFIYILVLPLQIYIQATIHLSLQPDAHLIYTLHHLTYRGLTFHLHRLHTSFTNHPR